MAEEIAFTPKQKTAIVILSLVILLSIASPFLFGLWGLAHIDAYHSIREVRYLEDINLCEEVNALSLPVVLPRDGIKRYTIAVFFPFESEIEESIVFDVACTLQVDGESKYVQQTQIILDEKSVKKAVKDFQEFREDFANSHDEYFSPGGNSSWKISSALRMNKAGVFVTILEHGDRGYGIFEEQEDVSGILQVTLKPVGGSRIEDCKGSLQIAWVDNDFN